MDNEQFYVTHCKFVEKWNIFIICLTDAKKKSSSKLEVHSFKHLSPLNESYGCYLAKKDRKDKYELLDEPLQQEKGGIFSKCYTSCCPQKHASTRRTSVSKHFKLVDE